MKNLAMRWISLAIVLLFTTSITAQGIEESFDQNCNCWTITNHYDNGEVSSIHHENEARKRDGEAVTYNTEGQVLRRENWANGRLDGKSQHYHADGSLYMEADYDNGKKTGTWTFREPDGTPTQQIEYSGNGADGVYSHYYAGVKYMSQTIEQGQLVNTEVLNEEIYEIVQEEASQTEK